MFRVVKSPHFWFVLILFLAAFLRFYRLPEYLRFLGDEGRDVLVVKRMIVDQQFTLLGPTTSVGGFYTGPIYYYFMAPFLWLSNLDPVGPAVMAALFGLGTVVLMYYFCKELFDEKVALIAAFLTTISPKMLEISRFSWNPNPMPFFALSAIFCLYLAKTRSRKICTLLSGVCLGILYQLHYIDLAFIPVIGLCLLLLFPRRQWWVQIALVVLGFLAGDSLFLIFELRHGFPNTKTALEFIFRGGQTVAPRSFNLVWLINDISRILYEIVLGFRGPVLNVLYYLSVICFGYWVITKRELSKIILLATWWLLGAFGIGLYRGTLLDHYFGYLFPVPLIFLSLTGVFLLQKKILLPFLGLFLAALVYFSGQKWYLWQKPNNLVAQTKTVDEIVLALASNQPYNLALLTSHNSDHAYRYFLEVWQRKPVVLEPPQTDPSRQTVTGQLIVVCEQADCEPRGNPLWEVAGFGQGEIVETRQGPAGIKVLKLVHYDESQKLKIKS